MERGRVAFAGEPDEYAKWKGGRTPPLRAAATAAALGGPPRSQPGDRAGGGGRGGISDAAGSEDLDPRDLVMSLEDGFAVWQPRASEVPELEGIQEESEEGSGSVAAGGSIGGSFGSRGPARAGGGGGGSRGRGGPGAPVLAAVLEGESGGKRADAASGRADGKEAAVDAGEGAAGVEAKAEAEVEEERAAGAVGWSVCAAYLRAVGWPMVGAVLVSLALMQVGGVLRGGVGHACMHAYALPSCRWAAS